MTKEEVERLKNGDKIRCISNPVSNIFTLFKKYEIIIQKEEPCIRDDYNNMRYVKFRRTRFEKVDLMERFVDIAELFEL